MVKLKNYNVVLKHFVLLLTFTLFFSCAEKKYHVSRIEGKKLELKTRFPKVLKLKTLSNPIEIKSMMI